MQRFIAYYPNGFLIVNGLVYCVLVAMFLQDAQGVFATLGVQLVSPQGFTELNTTYIGLMASLGLFSMLGAFYTPLRLGAVLIAAISYFFLGLVRSWGIFIEGNPDSMMMTFLIVEVMCVALAAVALACLKKAAAE